MFSVEAFQIQDVFSPAGQFSTFGQLASDIIAILIATAGVLSFIFIIIGGIKIVTASGDSKKLASAGSTILYAIIGLAVTILAFVILRVVQFVLKSNVPVT